ncbi:helicase-related protein [Isoptericola sp. NPDC019482]|uniref:helicase-related protein n=1 Tax=Isoptericola sp. NPDC019482 TaxID=3154688 RepID=UPI00346C0354
MTGTEARQVVEDSVRRELFGPVPGQGPQGRPLDCSAGKVKFPTAEESRGVFHDAATLEEVLTQAEPLKRYGIGVLYSGAAASGTFIPATSGSPDIDVSWVPGLANSPEDPPLEPAAMKGTPRFDEPDSDDFDLSDANNFKPSAMAVSFQCRVSAGGTLNLEVRGAYYDKVSVEIPGVARAQDWWVRVPFVLSGSVPAEVLLGSVKKLMNIPMAVASGPEQPRLKPITQVFSRPVPGEGDDDLRLVTVAVVNQTVGSGSASALFQVSFRASAGEGLTIESYPDIEQPDLDDEEQSIALLYRHKLTYAIGHGCAASWAEPRSTAGTSSAWVGADPIPVYEVVSLTPNVYVGEGSARRAVTVSMAALAADSDEGREQVEAVLRLYEEWIGGLEDQVGDLPTRYQRAARDHVRRCRAALGRMTEGWKLVTTSTLASEAFRLANEAMLQQQVRSRLPLREVEQGKDKIWRVVGAHPAGIPQPGQGQWRPFQIAFILASLPELIDPSHAARELVDLIFFPTGGGKTEAYLGASAVSLIARRLRDRDDAGTDTLMRYTLRLLTAQQFLRAAALVCVLEDQRSKAPEKLGDTPFGIGIWLGGSSTPNRWTQAVEALKQLRRSPQAQNKFLLLRCPWCGAQMGTKQKGSQQEVIGYEQVGTKVVLRCIDPACRFTGRKGLPVHVVDEDIYSVRPSIIIGTVDKFAMMAWRPEARRIFGLGDDGAREVSPPSVIIQDELHLISGPLGSMVGLYEPVIDELCTDRRGPAPVAPKIIASTATVRRYEDQIRGLFGRAEVALFPPHGLEEGHSFFAEPETRPDGSPAPGRRYLGVMSSSLGSMQTVQVRVAASTLQAAASISEADRDGYWTNLNFLNSLRELGNTVSLLESDVPDYLTALRRRDGLDPRWPRNTMELTSRRRSDEIPKAIEQLQIRVEDDSCIDICLASNIIEVGVDIDRLGLMTIVGQPKTTAQYIQVSGRVGRRPDVSPGLVITIYGAAKPRDRSHYERFRTYHQQLYAQVEPTSVTPFATPVLRRALHGAAVAYIRQVAPAAEPYPFPREEYDAAIKLLRARAEIADEGELPILDILAAKRAQQWEAWERTEWEANVIGGDPKQGLMRYAGTLPDLDAKTPIWDIPTSMRNVDAECRLQISQAYAMADAELGGEIL